MTSINKKRLILFFLLLVIILLLLNSIMVDRDYSNSSLINSTAEEQVKINSLQGFNQVAFGSQAAYEAIVEKPLFVIGRNAVAEEKEIIQKGSLQVPDLILIGIIITPESEAAMFSDNKTKKYFTLKSGEEFKGWELNEILKDKVIFSTEERSHELLLHAEESKKPIKPSRPRRK